MLYGTVVERYMERYFVLQFSEGHYSNLLKNLETVPQIYSLSQIMILSYLPSRNCHANVLKSLHKPSNSGSHVFPHHPSGYNMLVLEMFLTCSRIIFDHL